MAAPCLQPRSFSWLLLLAVTLLPLFSMAVPRQGDDPVRQIRRMTAFSSIRLELPARLEVRPGDFSVEVEATPDLQSQILTEVKGSTLVITLGDDVRWARDMRITVWMPELKGITLAGSGQAVLQDGLACKDLYLDIQGSGSIKGAVKAAVVKAAIHGSGDIVLQGKADALKGQVAGSGSLRTADLVVEEANLHIAGSGNIYTHVTQVLEASIAGSGSVRYKGKPSKVNQSVAGSGRISTL